MSNDLTTSKSNTDISTAFAIPEHMKDRLGVLDTAGGGGGSRYQMSFSGNRFTIKLGGEVLHTQAQPFPVVILGTANAYQRRYYSNPVPGPDPKAPDCWSANGVEPHSSVAKPQSEKCATCTQGAKNSRVINGRGTRACGFYKAIAVIPFEPIPEHEDAVVAMNMSGYSIWGDKATVTNIKTKEAQLIGYPYSQYAELLAEKQFMSFQVVTMIDFDPNVSVPRPMLKPVADVTKYPEVVARVNAAFNNKELEAIINCEKPPM